MPDLDQIEQGEPEARDRRSLMFLVIWAMSVGPPRRPGGAAEARLSIVGLDVMVWKPDETAPAAPPIVVFSHGFHGCATQSRFLVIALASAGYLVVAPNHRDAICNGGSARWIAQGINSRRQPPREDPTETACGPQGCAAVRRSARGEA
jgi:Platelet-activating factor acetylhydrolase, isoform II